MRGVLSSPRCARSLMLTASAVAGLAIAVGVECAAEARPLDEVVASKSLRVIAYLDNKPFSWEEGGTAKGIDVDLGRALARKLGVEAEVVLRMQGEKADDDLRANVWKGPLTGGGVGDVMLHVPYDREFALRNREAVIANPYFEERIAVAIHPERTGQSPTFDVFKKEYVGVQLGTVADYFLMTYEDGALIETIRHHVKPVDGVKRFLGRETAALMGVRSQIESLLFEAGANAPIVEPEMPGIVRQRWLVGMAVKENSHDLKYALEAALKELVEAGELRAICAEYGVAYMPAVLP